MHGSSGLPRCRTKSQRQVRRWPQCPRRPSPSPDRNFRRRVCYSYLATVHDSGQGPRAKVRFIDSELSVRFLIIFPFSFIGRQESGNLSSKLKPNKDRHQLLFFNFPFRSLSATIIAAASSACACQRVAQSHKDILQYHNRNTTTLAGLLDDASFVPNLFKSEFLC